MLILERRLGGLIELPALSVPDYTDINRRELAEIIREDGEFQTRLTNALGSVHKDIVAFALASLTGQRTLEGVANSLGRSREWIRQIFRQLAKYVRTACTRGEWDLVLEGHDIGLPRGRFRLLYIVLYYLYSIRSEYRPTFAGVQGLSLAEEFLLTKLTVDPATEFWQSFRRAHWSALSGLSKKMQPEIIPRFLRDPTLEVLASHYCVQPSTVETALRKIVNGYAARKITPATFDTRPPRSRRSVVFYRWYFARMVIEYYYTDYRVLQS